MDYGRGVIKTIGTPVEMTVVTSYSTLHAQALNNARLYDQKGSAELLASLE